MASLNICFELALNLDGGEDKSFWENNYQKWFKQFLTFLYTHPKIPFSLSLTGSQLDYCEDSHPEAIQMLSELTSRHQVEVLGGGYYEPALPLLFPVDRSGQIEKMNSALRSTIGKRPRGSLLLGSLWEPSLITTFYSCGIEYVCIDSALIPSHYRKFKPIITSEQGKTLKILPISNQFKPESGQNGGNWLKSLPLGLNLQANTSENSFVLITLSIEELASLLSSDFFKELQVELETQDFSNIVLTLPQTYLKNVDSYITAYIPAGMDSNLSRWGKNCYRYSQSKNDPSLTIYDYLNVYMQNRRLYDRMVYISMFIAQCHGGDKMRKKAAQEKLWESQSLFNYINLPSGLPAIAKKRQKAYSLLNEAEKLIRESKEVKESLTTFDYNSDGFNEYVCQLKKLHAVISPIGAQICDLNIISVFANYAANLSKIKEFDGDDDKYYRGFFVEHLFENSESSSFFKGQALKTETFANTRFVETKFDSRRNEIHLAGKGLFSRQKLPVSLNKNYIVSSDGFVVQYILKNESPFAVKGVFSVEVNFAQTDFDSKKQESQYHSELILKGNRQVFLAEKSFHAENGVSVLQVTDSVRKIAFLFEPNEESGFFSQPLTFKRPVTQLAPEGLVDVDEVSKTLSIQFCWNIDLAVGHSTEKTINLSIIPVKKRHKK